MRSEDLSWFKCLWVPSTSWLSLRCVALNRLRYRRALFSHLGQDMTRQRHAQRSPSSCCYTINLSQPDNNALSPQACSNTCWRDRLLPNACNNQSPRVWLCPENWPKLLVNISSVNPAQIPPIWPLPLFPLCFSPFTQSTHYLHISLSWLLSFYSLNPFFWLFFSLQFCLSSSLFVAMASWDLCMGPIQIFCVRRGQCKGLNVTQLCEIWVCMLCLRVRISVCNHEGLLLTANKPLQTTVFILL